MSSPEAHAPRYLVARVTLDGGIEIWEVGGERLRVLRSYGWRPRRLVFSGDGARLAVAYANGVVRIWSMEDMELEHELVVAGIADGTPTLAMSPDGMWLAATWDVLPRIWIWNTVSGKQLQELACGGSPILCAGFSLDGQSLACGDIDGQVWCFTKPQFTRSPKPATMLGRSSHGVVALSFSPDGENLVVASRAERVHWDLRTAQESLRVRLVPTRPTRWICYSPDGSHLGLASYNGWVEVVQLSPDQHSSSLRATTSHSMALLWDDVSAALILLNDSGVDRYRFFCQQPGPVTLGSQLDLSPTPEHIWSLPDEPLPRPSTGLQAELQGALCQVGEGAGLAVANALIEQVRAAYAENAWYGIGLWLDLFGSHLEAGHRAVCQALLAEIEGQEYSLPPGFTSWLESRRAALMLRQGLSALRRGEFVQASAFYRQSLDLHRQQRCAEGVVQAELALESLENEQLLQYPDAGMRRTLCKPFALGDSAQLIAQQLAQAGASRLQVAQAALKLGLSQPLLDVLTAQEVQLRIVAAMALGQLIGLPTLGPLIRALSDENWMVRWRVTEALAAQPEEQFQEDDRAALAQRMQAESHPEVRRSLSRLFSRFALPSDTMILIPWLADPDPEIRMGIVETLARVGRRRAVTALREVEDGPDLTEKTVPVAAAAKRAILAIRSRSPKPPVIEQLWLHGRRAGVDPRQARSIFILGETVSLRVKLSNRIANPQLKYKVQLIAADATTVQEFIGTLGVAAMHAMLQAQAESPIQLLDVGGEELHIPFVPPVGNIAFVKFLTEVEGEDDYEELSQVPLQLIEEVEVESIRLGYLDPNFPELLWPSDVFRTDDREGVCRITLKRAPLGAPIAARIRRVTVSPQSASYSILPASRRVTQEEMQVFDLPLPIHGYAAGPVELWLTLDTRTIAVHFRIVDSIGVRSLEVGAGVSSTSSAISPAQTFSTEQPLICCLASLSVVPARTEVMASWYWEQELICSSTAMTRQSGSQRVYFQLSRPHLGWPAGKYEVRVGIPTTDIPTDIPTERSEEVIMVHTDCRVSFTVA